MNYENETPFGPGWPSKQSLEYFSALCTAILLALGVPYLVLLFFRNPAKAVGISGRV
jgi:hypothetical protein